METGHIEAALSSDLAFRLSSKQYSPSQVTELASALAKKTGYPELIARPAAVLIMYADCMFRAKERTLQQQKDNLPDKKALCQQLERLTRPQKPQREAVKALSPLAKNHLGLALNARKEYALAAELDSGNSEFSDVRLFCLAAEDALANIKKSGRGSGQPKRSTLETFIAEVADVLTEFFRVKLLKEPTPAYPVPSPTRDFSVLLAICAEHCGYGEELGYGHLVNWKATSNQTKNAIDRLTSGSVAFRSFHLARRS